jgi:hypothetical protein
VDLVSTRLALKGNKASDSIKRKELLTSCETKLSKKGSEPRSGELKFVCVNRQVLCVGRDKSGLTGIKLSANFSYS